MNSSYALDKSNAKALGVCAGLAHHFALDVTLVRVLYVLVSVLSAAFPGILVYIILWIVIPEEPAS